MQHTTATTTLTLADLEAGYADPRWLGFGYLGERRRAADTSDAEASIDPATIARADALVLRVAGERGWDRERLFTWSNSIDGRHFADGALGRESIPAWAVRLIR